MFVADGRYFIRQTTSPAGFRWSDRQGNVIDYDANGRFTGYGDRNDVRVRFERDGDGRIATIRDHGNAIALTLTYAGGQIATIRDRVGREVRYTWTGGNLTGVRDVMGRTWTYGYETNGQLTSITDPLSRAWQIAYVQTFRVGGVGAPSGVSTSGRPPRDFRVSSVATLTDPVGSVWRYAYTHNRERRSWSVTERTPAGRISERTYDLNGRLLAQTENDRSIYRRSFDGNRVEIVIDERGLTTRRELDSFRNPTRVTHPDGTSETWAYHPQWSVPTEHVDPRGTRTTWQYDGRGNLVLRTEAQGTPDARVMRYVYNAYGELTEQTLAGAVPAEDVTTRHTFDGYGNLAERTDAMSQVTAFTHDVMGNVLTTTDARGHTWTNTFDAAGRVLSQSNPLGHTLTHTVDLVGNRLTTTDAAGNTTTLSWDGRDRMLTSTDPLGGVTTMTYDAEGRPLTQTDASGPVTTYAYDPRGRLVSVTDGAGNVTRTEYGDAASGLEGLVTAMVYPTYREEYRYDPRNRRTQVIRVHPAADGEPERRETTTTAYDGVGNVIAKIDALGRTTQQRYDRLNRLIEVTDPLGGKTVHAYDLRDNLLALTDASGNTHRFTYDKVDRMRTEARPLGQTIRYAYNAAGNLTERIDPKNQRQVHTYDAAGRRTRTETFAAASETAAKTISFTYDSRGLLTGYDDGLTTGTYTYDANGRRSSESVDFGSFTRTVGITHTPVGRIAGMTYPDGASVAYRYDAAGRLSELEHPGGVMRYTAYQWQRATRVVLPGGLTRRESFDALQRTTRIEVGTTASPTAVMDHRYTYNAVGNITEKATRTGATTYGYDALDRLTQATPPATSSLPAESYSYDAVHNRAASAHQPGPWTYDANNALTQWGEGSEARSLEYDANGNLIREQRGATTRTFGYDELDRLIEVRDSGQVIARYAYDPFARRVKKETIAGGATTITWSLSIQRGLIAEYDQNGQLKQDWQWEPDAPWSTGPVAQRTRDGQTLRSHQIHTDHLWTPVALTDAQGNVAWRAQHEAFGAPIIEAGATATTPWRFPGQYADAETGLSWNLWRHYDPRTGRYTQSDPIGIWGGFNLWTYGRANTLTYFDHLGLKACMLILSIPGIWSNDGPPTIVNRTDWNLFRAVTESSAEETNCRRSPLCNLLGKA